MTPEEERDYLIERYRAAVRERDRANAAVDLARNEVARASTRYQRAADTAQAFHDVLLAEGLNEADIFEIERAEAESA